MRKALKWRYYCDHCKRSGASGAAMAKHEKHCTMNPARACRMCEMVGLTPHAPAHLVAVWHADGWQALLSAAGECPACILAAVRLHQKQPVGMHEYGEDDVSACDCQVFNFKAAVATLFGELNRKSVQATYAGYPD